MSLDMLLMFANFAAVCENGKLNRNIYVQLGKVLVDKLLLKLLLLRSAFSESHTRIFYIFTAPKPISIQMKSVMILDK